VCLDHIARRIIANANHGIMRTTSETKRRKCGFRANTSRIPLVKSLEIIADNLHKAGFSLGWVSALDLEGRTLWIVDAHGYGNRFIVRADEMLTAFLELERAIHGFAVSLIA
jgi:hypothetical protein